MLVEVPDGTGRINMGGCSVTLGLLAVIATELERNGSVIVTGGATAQYGPGAVALEMGMAVAGAREVKKRVPKRFISHFLKVRTR